MTDLLLGIDVGTTYCKAVVFDVDGRGASHARARTPWTAVGNGAEIDPSALVRTAQKAAAEAIAGGPAGAVVAVGIAGMGETGVLVDARGRALGPAIAWHDARGTGEAREIEGELGGGSSRATPACRPRRCARSRSCAGSVPISKGSRRPCAGSGSRSGSPARWVPPTWRSCRWPPAPACSSSARRRGGRAPSTGSASGDDFLAEPVAAGTPLGRVSDALPAARGAVITVAGHDHVAATIGAGACREGDVLHSAGPPTSSSARSTPTSSPIGWPTRWPAGSRSGGTCCATAGRSRAATSSASRSHRSSSCSASTARRTGTR